MGPEFRQRVRFFIRDVREFEGRPDGYDLIVTHFFLDCFTEHQLMGVVGRLASWGDRDVRWVLSDFCEGAHPIHRLWTRAIIRSLYAFFRLTTGLQVTRMPNYTAALAREGFTHQYECKTLGGLLRSSLWVAPIGPDLRDSNFQREEAIRT